MTSSGLKVSHYRTRSVIRDTTLVTEVAEYRRQRVGDTWLIIRYQTRSSPSALLQKRHEFIHSEQELADVVVQHRLPQRVTGMKFAE